MLTFTLLFVSVGLPLDYSRSYKHVCIFTISTTDEKSDTLFMSFNSKKESQKVASKNLDKNLYLLVGKVATTKESLVETTGRTMHKVKRDQPYEFCQKDHEMHSMKICRTTLLWLYSNSARLHQRFHRKKLEEALDVH